MALTKLWSFWIKSGSVVVYKQVHRKIVSNSDAEEYLQDWGQVDKLERQRLLSASTASSIALF